jgi:hypothetical protein
MSPIPKKIPVIAAIVLAAGLVLLLRPAKPKIQRARVGAVPSGEHPRAPRIVPITETSHRETGLSAASTRRVRPRNPTLVKIDDRRGRGNLNMAHKGQGSTRRLLRSAKANRRSNRLKI